ncbi:MAG: helix-hairpin-helix domain-containing protein [Wenzhouxiangella sp.]|nr:helix-hairpin-helix domain-containing protein [Wenzhouxiangella sp.]
MIKKTIAAIVLSLALAGLSIADMTRIDINSATVEELTQLHGVGTAKAEAIVAYREENGPFAHVDELVNVRGIGLRTVDQNRERLSLEASDSD